MSLHDPELEKQYAPHVKEHHAPPLTENAKLEFMKQNTIIANTWNPFFMIFVTPWEKKSVNGCLSMIVSYGCLRSDKF
jgi:hypothetical protein